MKTNYINKENLINSLKTFSGADPFDHCVVDNFFDLDVAKELESEFPDFHSDIWHGYDNPLEVKRLSNNWNLFPETTYKIFNYLNSDEVVSILSDGLKGIKLFQDNGLNGGGWHIHTKGGKLNTHLDYSLHPKLKLQRKLNIIVYLNSNWQNDWGGHLGLWGNENDQKPGDLVKSIEPIFNRAVIFDTTQNSWHGLPIPLTCPDGESRKSIAVYYLCEPNESVDTRGKALFAPTKEQEGDESIEELIKKRSSVEGARSVYNSE